MYMNTNLWCCCLLCLSIKDIQGAMCPSSNCLPLTLSCPEFFAFTSEISKILKSSFLAAIKLSFRHNYVYNNNVKTLLLMLGIWTLGLKQTMEMLHLSSITSISNYYYKEKLPGAGKSNKLHIKHCYSLFCFLSENKMKIMTPNI